MSTARDIDAIIDRIEDIMDRAPDEVYDIVCLLKDMRARAITREKRVMDIMNRLAALRSDVAYIYVQGGL